MKTVGAFEAKTKLSELLRDVEANHEEIIITKRRQSIARLVPFRNDSDKNKKGLDLVKAFREIREKQNGETGNIASLIEEGRKR